MIRQEAQPRGGCVTRCKRTQARAPALHKFSGNSLHNFALKNLFVDNEIAGVGRTPWRSMGETKITESELIQGTGMQRRKYAPHWLVLCSA
jgi:hypothetical protein